MTRPVRNRLCVKWIFSLTLSAFFLFCAILVQAQAPPADQSKATPPAGQAAPAPAPADAQPAIGTPDPSGGDSTKAGTAIGAGLTSISADELKKLTDEKDKPATNGTVLKAFDAAGQTAVSINFVWMLVCGFLVMFMQLGFAMVETGFCRAKHASHVVMTNFMIYSVGMLGFWICGFALMYGSQGGIGVLGGNNILAGGEFRIGNFGIAGLSGFFLNPKVYDVAVYGFFLFQMVFMDTTATIPTGGMAERWRFTAFIIYGFFISMICYPIYGHLMWGNGGLAMLGQNYKLGHGAVDFAGSSVVHAVGGFVALAGAKVIGARRGKFNADGSSNVLKPHDIPMATFGAFVLAFGWFGFNAGSTLAASGGNLRIAVIATNTMLASASGAFVACILIKLMTKKYDPGMMINGLLAGLVAITAPCAFVDSLSSVIIGAIAAIICVLSVGFVEKKLKIDDPVGAFSVHGACGIFGLIAVGLFADGSFGGGFNGVGTDSYLGKAGLGVTGLFHGDSSQLIAQVIAAVVCMVWAFGSAYVFFTVQKKVMRIRSLEADEDAGLDIPEMGVEAYPEFIRITS